MLILTTKHSISLKSLLIKKKLPIKVAFTFQSDIDKLKSGTLPEIVARIYQLIDSSIETTLIRNLSFSQPVY